MDGAAVTPTDLKQWRGNRSRAEVARLLGCGERSIINWETVREPPQYIALAIAALQFNLPPYGSK